MKNGSNLPARVPTPVLAIDEVETAIAELQPSDFAPKSNGERIARAAELISQSVRQTVEEVTRAGIKSLAELEAELAGVRKGWEAFAGELAKIADAHALALDAFHGRMRSAADTLEQVKQASRRADD
jgi:hypothetical protein